MFSNSWRLKKMEKIPTNSKPCSTTNVSYMRLGMMHIMHSCWNWISLALLSLSNMWLYICKYLINSDWWRPAISIICKGHKVEILYIFHVKKKKHFPQCRYHQHQLHNIKELGEYCKVSISLSLSFLYSSILLRGSELV